VAAVVYVGKMENNSCWRDKEMTCVVV